MSAAVRPAESHRWSASSPAPVAAVLLLDLLQRLGVADAHELRAVHDLALREPRLAHAARLRDGGLLLLADGTLDHALLLVLLAEAGHGELERGLRGVVGHG